MCPTVRFGEIFTEWSQRCILGDDTGFERRLIVSRHACGEWLQTLRTVHLFCSPLAGRWGMWSSRALTCGEGLLAALIFKSIYKTVPHILKNFWFHLLLYIHWDFCDVPLSLSSEFPKRLDVSHLHTKLHPTGIIFHFSWHLLPLSLYSHLETIYSCF